jgi:hypothetical protein
VPGWLKTARARQAAADEGDSGVSAATQALGPAAPCVANPCNIGCQFFDENPASDITIDDALCSSAIESGDYSGVPGGFLNKLIQDPCNPSKPEDCQTDMFCDAGSNECTAWPDGDYDSAITWNTTLKLGCEDKPIVCNRGGVPTPSNLVVTVIQGNANQLQNNIDDCTAGSCSTKGQCTVPAPIDPGDCVSVTGCEAWMGSGSRTLVVNSQAQAGFIAGEAECHDNWSFDKATQYTGCTGGGAEVHAFEYTATCPGHQRPSWDFLAYEAELLAPSNSIVIDVHTANPPTTPLGPSSPCTDCITVADVAVTHPEICSMGAPAPCPVDVGTVLGLPLPTDPQLELVVSLTAADCDDKPKLKNWEVYYTCADYE